ncbi:MAG: hypothetical protein IJK04_07480 [Kiritimatiellae bacterium]|nr:hypothetical protein [Kiritimatiellia bacterium]
MSRLCDILSGKEDNYLLPFYWQHGDHTDKIPGQIAGIAASGCRALCVEARPHPDFAGPGWWHDMDVILAECKRRGMKVWILDDKHFPTGYANGAVEKRPKLRRWNLGERHVDVAGPAKGASLILWPPNDDPEARLFGVYAYRRAEGGGERLCGPAMDLTGCVRDGCVRFDVPEGFWRVFFVRKTRKGSNEKYIDLITAESAALQIEAVYEPHWRHYGEEFGKTIAGFFSDEPQFGNFVLDPYWSCVRGDPGRYNYGIGQPGLALPVNDALLERMSAALGEDARLHLGELWYEGDRSPEARLAYMDALTTLYRDCFARPVGDWCRAHGVEYIGHIVEDMNTHARMGLGPGHYFRAIEGQDMGGIDIVLHHVIPGMGHLWHTASTLGGAVSPDFFHCVLAQLATSIAHQTPRMKGRAMCEVFGAYGWAEGAPMMKWLIDFLLVRGVNHFVPHAFSPQYPDPDCPPHFGAEGHDPQFEGFTALMRYANKAAHLLSGGRHVARAAILYHAEGEWMNGIGNAMLMEVPARILSDAHIPYEIVSRDALGEACAADGAVTVGEMSFKAIVVPYAPRLPEDLLAKLAELANAGIRVVFAGGLPRGAVGEVTELADLPDAVRKACGEDVAFPDGCGQLSHLHIVRDGCDAFMFFNEEPSRKASIDVRLPTSGACVCLKLLEDRVWREEVADGRLRLDLEPGESQIVVFGEECGDVAGGRPRFGAPKTVAPVFDIAVADEREPDVFTPIEATKELFNVYDRLPDFAGRIRYRFAIDGTEAGLGADGGRAVIDLGVVGEVAKLKVDGRDMGIRIARPYRFEVELAGGRNEVEVEVATSLGMRVKDRFSRFLAIPAAGLQGPVTIRDLRVQSRKPML